MKQATVKTEVVFEGVGLHSGRPVTLKVQPKADGPGFTFCRTDLDRAILEITADTIKSSSRMTVLQGPDFQIQTPEHLMSAFYGLGITQATIALDSEELPILDGSSWGFYEVLSQAGVSQLEAESPPLVFKTPIFVTDADKRVMGFPSLETCSFSYALDYHASFVGSQTFTFSNNQDYGQEIAKARTYGFETEIEALRAQGLAKGGSLDNALVIGQTDYLNPPLRYSDELVRHKVLDLMGDLWLLGRPILGHVVGIHSGHALNAQFLRHLLAS